MKRTLWLIAALSLGLAGCIGTDLVEDLPTADARIDVENAPGVCLSPHHDSIAHVNSVEGGIGR